MPFIRPSTVSYVPLKLYSVTAKKPFAGGGVKGLWAASGQNRAAKPQRGMQS